MPKDNYVALTRCYYCGEGNEIILHRRFGDVSRFDGKVVDKRPCPKCEEYMRKGIILISARDPNPSGGNALVTEKDSEPYRTGGFWVIKQEAAEQLFKGFDFTTCRCSFIPNSVARQIGLPNADKLVD